MENPYPYEIRVGEEDDAQLHILWKHGRFRVDEFPTGARFTLPAGATVPLTLRFRVPEQLSGESFDVGFALCRAGYTNWFNGKPRSTEVDAK